MFIAAPLSALDGVAVIDMRTAVLSTQAAAEAFKALEEDSEYSSNLEEAKSLQADRQAIAEKLQKELETLSQDQIAEMQKDIADKGRDLEFLAGKIQQAQEETAQAVFAQSGPAMQKIISELIAAKQQQSHDLGAKMTLTEVGNNIVELKREQANLRSKLNGVEENIKTILYARRLKAFRHILSCRIIGKGLASFRKQMLVGI